jgi:hypothetical protein
VDLAEVILVAEASMEDIHLAVDFTADIPEVVSIQVEAIVQAIDHIVLHLFM